MLSYIKGIIKNIELNSIIVLTENGLGYEIIINELMYSNIYNKKEIEIFLYHNITENGQTLFGFLSFEDRVLFKELIKISGVGGRVAQNILSIGTFKLKKAILENDKKIIESIKGVGKKMSEKIILELADKDFIKNFDIEIYSSDKKQIKKIEINSVLKNEILSTLTSMGYNSKKIEDALNGLPEGYEKIEQIIPFILKNI